MRYFHTFNSVIREVMCAMLRGSQAEKTVCVFTDKVDHASTYAWCCSALSFGVIHPDFTCSQSVPSMIITVLVTSKPVSLGRCR